MLTHRNRMNQIRVLAAATAAVAFAAPVFAQPTPVGGTDGGAGREYYIGTTGATAFAAFTTLGDSGATPPGYSYGPNLVGTSSGLRIGNTFYPPTSSTGQAFIRHQGLGSFNPPSATDDRIVYSYHNLGSINGILDLAYQNGVLPPPGGPGTDPYNVTSTNRLFFHGLRFNSISSTASSTITSNFGVTAGALASPIPSNASGGGSTAGGHYQTVLGRKAVPQVAWSDVVTKQAFALAGTATVGSRPFVAGYGNGEPTGTAGKQPVFQALRPVAPSFLDPATTQLRNETVGVVPFTIATNPGTGISKLTQDELSMLQVRGRLPNGANFNYSTRDIGSGTRNQGGNNLGIDPTWAGGERDRVLYRNVTSVSGTSDTGLPYTIVPGDEQNPFLPMFSTTSGTVSPNEHRPSAIGTFADKTSGGGAIRPIVLQNRMALGILSAGDTGSRGRTGNNPIRVLSIQFEFQPGEQGLLSGGVNPGFVQPTASNVSSGSYRLYSIGQAVTVAGSAATGANRTGGVLGLVANDTVSSKPVMNDVIDYAGSPGVVRNWLNNLTNGIIIDPATGFSPFDTLVVSGFIPPSIMQATKQFDGDVQTATGISTAPGSDYARTVANGSNPINTTGLNFLPAATWNGGSISSQYYRAFDVNAAGEALGPGDAPSAAVQAVNVQLTTRTFLAGDLNGDGVRDLSDAAAWGAAYANPGRFLDADTTGIDSGQVVTNTALATANALTGEGALSPLNSRRLLTLLPLTDLNGSGNVVAVGTGGVDVAKPLATRFGLDSAGQVVRILPAQGFAVAWSNALSQTNNFQGATVNSPADRVDPITRDNVEFFIYGASIDTSGFATVADKLADGVRLGRLNINAAATAVNAALDTEAAIGGSPLTLVAAANQKFEIRDIDRSGSRAFANSTTGDKLFLDDAFLLDSQAGKDYSNIDDVLSTPIELTRLAIRTQVDNTDTIIGQKDMNVMDDALTTTAGVNPAGVVNHVWKTSFVKPGNLAIAISPAAGTITVPVDGATFTIGSGKGSFSAGGAVSVFTDSINGNKIAVVNNNAGGLVITTGTVDQNVKTLTGTGTTTVSTGGRLLVTPGAGVNPTAISQAALTVSGTAKVSPRASSTASISVLGALTVNIGGVLDLGNNDLIVRNGSVSAISTLAGTGRLIGSGGVADPRDAFATVGVLGNTDEFGFTRFLSFDGVSVNPADVLVKYTYRGDVDFNGLLDASDFNAVLNGITNALGGWENGDINYDGVANGTDWSLFLAAYAGQSTPFDIGGTVPAGSIPEPAALGLVLAAAPLLGRRRRA
jgi:hypothetical protein